MSMSRDVVGPFCALDRHLLGGPSRGHIPTDEAGEARGTESRLLRKKKRKEKASKTRPNPANRNSPLCRG